MAGHSKWANIKHRKGAQDARRAKVFTRIAREITVASRAGGGDPAANPRLRAAIAAARSANMPNDRIDRAVNKGTGEGGADVFEEVTYEGYGPGGVAVLVHALTDNRNRTTAEVRHLFGKYGGDLGSPGSVSWMFERKGCINVPRSEIGEETLLETILEAGAEDMKALEEQYEIVTPPDAFHSVRDGLESAGVEMSLAEVAMVPQNLVPVEGERAAVLLDLLEALEEHDDVQQVAANCEMTAQAAGA